MYKIKGMSKNHKTFELKIEHIALITSLSTESNKLALIGCVDTDLSPFSGDSLIEDLGHILIGRELTDEEKNKLTEDGIPFKSREDVEWLKQIYSELPTALDVVLNSKTFEPGTYRTRWYERNWKKID